MVVNWFNGDTWRQVSKIISASGTRLNVSTSESDNTVLITWKTRYPNENNYVTERFSTNGGTFLEPVPFNGFDVNFSGQLAGQSMMIHQDRGTTKASVWEAGNWSTPVDISQPVLSQGGYTRFPSVFATGQQDVGLVSWDMIQNQGTQVESFFRLHDGSDWQAIRPVSADHQGRIQNPIAAFNPATSGSDRTYALGWIQYRQNQASVVDFWVSTAQPVNPAQ